MSVLLEKLSQAAFRKAAAAEANLAIEAVRSERGTQAGPAINYEIALPGFAVDEFLLKKALPRLVYFLDCRGGRLEATAGIFVSMFTPEGLWFLEAGPTALLLGEHAGLSGEELVRRYGDGGAGDPLLLGT
jgi:hypothetical protein